MVEITRKETVGEGGVVHFAIPELEVGQEVDVTVRVNKPKRLPGRLKGLLTVPPEFDDPIPGMEDYS